MSIQGVKRSLSAESLSVAEAPEPSESKSAKTERSGSVFDLPLPAAGTHAVSGSTAQKTEKVALSGLVFETPREMEEKIAFYMDDADLWQFSRVSKGAAQFTEEEFYKRHRETTQHIQERHIPRYIALGGAPVGLPGFNEYKLRYFAFNKGYESLLGPSRQTLYGPFGTRPSGDPEIDSLVAITRSEHNDARKHRGYTQWMEDPDHQRALGRITELSTPRMADQHYTPLSVLPSEIRLCRNLEALDISHNEVQDLPDVFGSLEGLRRLNLSRNPLSELPPSVDTLRGVRELRVDGTEIPAAEIERVLNVLLNQERPLLTTLGLNQTQLLGLSEECIRILIPQLNELTIVMEGPVPQDMDQIIPRVNEFLQNLEPLTMDDVRHLSFNFRWITDIGIMNYSARFQ